MNIIEMAKQAHRKLVTEVYVGHMGQLDPWTIELLKIFAKLVAAQEREACAKLAEEWDKVNKLSNYGAFIALQIRERGTT